MRIAETEMTLTPEEALAAWPRLEPLAAIWSGGVGWRSRNPRCRWTILSRPVETRIVTGGPCALERLRDQLGLMEQAVAPAAGSLPFVGGWMGFLSYEAGGVLEPAAATTRRTGAGGWPLAVWQRCPGAYVHDRWTGQWWTVGDDASLPQLHAVRARDAGEFLLGALTSEAGHDEYVRRVERVIGDIRSGDVFQANIAHRLSGAFEGSARALFAEMCRSAQPWHGAYIEFDHEGERSALVSMSPELFLEYDGADRRVTTRPMKGTRPLRAGAAGARDLARSEKDSAELNMIVDLMRNDLGRVCCYGSVRVDDARTIESHGGAEGNGGGGAGVLQGVATVSGTLRDECTFADLIVAAFPPGSVTGAPKIRAMQIIDELEGAPRGAYCGCVGYLSDHGHAALNVAIRTAVVRGRPGGVAPDEIADARLTYSVGAGIVADSVPEEEWRETLVKAGSLAGLTSVREE